MFKYYYLLTIIICVGYCYVVSLLCEIEIKSTNQLNYTVMKKSIIQKNISPILTKYRSNNGYMSIIDIYNGNIDDVISGKFTNDVISFCDLNCSNGHYSRWTNFGVDLVNDAIDFTKEISDLLITK